MATLIPDTLYLRGRAVIRGPGETPRPEVSLCRSCLIDVLESELASYTGRMVACEPDAENFSQYFFVASGDFEAAGLQPETATAISQCLARPADQCAECSRAATWLWLTREEVASLDDSGSITSAPGRRLCAAHGAATLCDALGNVPEANLFYVNVPYGEAGAYLWI